MSTGKTTPKPEALLNELMSAIQRTGPVFTGQASLYPEADGYRGRLQLVHNAFHKNEVGAELQTAFVRYMREYLRSNGWKPRLLKVCRSYVEFDMTPSKARSSRSKNL